MKRFLFSGFEFIAMTLHNQWWQLIWPFLFGGISLAFFPKQKEYVLGKRVERWNWLPALMLAIPYVVWAGYRKDFGDTEQYRATFLSLPSSFSQIASYMSSVRKGHGFRLLELLFKCLVSRSDISLFLFLAAIQILCLVYVYRKYSINYWLSFFLFVASTDYITWMHNGIRQFLAASILFLCIPMIAQKRYLSVVIITLLVSQIHATALIFLPFIFIVNGRAWNLRTLLFIVAMVGAVLFVDRITGFLEQAMVDTAYEGDIEILRTNGGTHILRVLFYSIPAFMCWFFRPYLDRANDPLINVCANLSIVSAGFYVFSFFTSGILMGAIPIYFSLANYILIPWLIAEVFDSASALVVQLGFIGVYSYFFYYQVGLTWGLL